MFGRTVFGVTQKKTRLKIVQKCQVKTKGVTTTKAHWRRCQKAGRGEGRVWQSFYFALKSQISLQAKTDYPLWFSSHLQYSSNEGLNGIALLRIESTVKCMAKYNLTVESTDEMVYLNTSFPVSHTGIIGRWTGMSILVPLHTC